MAFHTQANYRAYNKQRETGMREYRQAVADANGCLYPFQSKYDGKCSLSKKPFEKGELICKVISTGEYALFNSLDESKGISLLNERCSK